MSTLSHHLKDETLQDYSAGVLSVPMETLIACHLTLCPECRKRVELTDAIGGLSLNDGATATMNVTAEDILQLDRKTRATDTDKKTPVANCAGVPKPLARLLPGPLHDLPWKSFGPGMKQFNLGTQPRKQGAFKLISLEPGSRMSKHTHGHRELTFIVSGSYSDELGQFEAGDISDLSANHHHTPHVSSDVPCISLIATDAPVKFDGLFARIIQPFVGI